MQTVRQYKKTVIVAAFLAAVLIVAAFAALSSFTPSSSPSPSPLSTSSPSPSPLFTSTPPPIQSPTISPTPAFSSTPTTLPTFTPLLTPYPFTTSPIFLYPGEVTEYQGKPLSPIVNVYQNAIAGTQYINQSTYELTIQGLVNKTLYYTYDQVLNHQRYQKVVTIYCVEGWSATILWEGVLVKDLLEDAQYDPTAQVVVFSASDHYTTSLPVDYILQNDIIIAYKMNGVTLQPETGWPFMLISQSQYGYKWIKWLTGISVSNDIDYKGYWESRGFPNNATIP